MSPFWVEYFLYYNITMKITVKAFLEKFRARVGDSSSSIPTKFLIEAINSSFNKLATTPKLARAFRKHYTVDLKAKDGCKWKLEGDFRRIADIPMMNFYSIGEGGDPCPLTICPLNDIEFYNKHGLVSMKQAGVPCEYTLEQEGDDTWLVLDRPSDVPLIVDYIIYGYVAPIEDLEHQVLDEHGNPMKNSNGQIIMEDTTIEISAVIEDLVLSSMVEAMYKEAEDEAFAGATLDILSNKLTPEALQMLYKTLGVMPAAILGEA